MQESTATEIVLQTRQLTRRFAGVLAVDRVDFTLRRNELRCLVGPNGAGKSTFFKCVTGQYPPTSGSVTLFGEDIAGMAPHQIARRGVGIKTQVPSLFDGLTALENVALSAMTKLSAHPAEAAAQRALERVGVADLASKCVGILAHGQRQLVELAMVTVGEPQLILLDEPAAGMTSRETVRMAESLRELAKSASVIVVEHDMSFVRRVAHVVTVFHRGAVLREGGIDDVLSDPVVRDVYLGKGKPHA